VNVTPNSVGAQSTYSCAVTSVCIEVDRLYRHEASMCALYMYTVTITHAALQLCSPRAQSVLAADCML
jgi:hypothetical protein